MIKSSVKIFSGEPMKSGDIFRLAASIVAGVGVDMAISALIGAHMPAGTGWKKLMRKIGLFVISMKAGEEAEEYFGKLYDETKEALTEAKTEIHKPVEGEGRVE